MAAVNEMEIYILKKILWPFIIKLILLLMV